VRLTARGRSARRGVALTGLAIERGNMLHPAVSEMLVEGQGGRWVRGSRGNRARREGAAVAGDTVQILKVYPLDALVNSSSTPEGDNP
jgi:hypothetical protein